MPKFGRGLAGNLKQVWAVGTQREATPFPDPVREAPVKVSMLKAEGREAEIRYHKVVVPDMESSEVTQIEPKTTISVTPTITPLTVPAPMVTPLWLDPQRYGELDNYNNLNINAARIRGIRHETAERGYTRAQLNWDHKTVIRQIREAFPDIMQHVEESMEEYIPGYTADPDWWT